MVILLKGFLLFLLTILYLSEYSFPQPFPSKFSFEKFSVEHGLSSSAVYSVLQDKTGFLWLGTENGLNRYDGYSFKIFKHNPDDENSISDNFIWDICEDKEGNLWLATNNGLNMYNPLTGKFTRYFHNPDYSNSLSGNEISSLINDADGNLWIGTWTSGISIFNLITKKFDKLADDNIDFSNEVIWTLLKDKRNNIWIGTESGNLFRYNWNNKKLISFNGSGNNSFSVNAVTSLCEDISGNIWISTYGSGISRYNYDTGSFIHFRHDKNNINSISDDFIWKIFEDSRGQIWIGSVSRGLTIYDTKKNMFTRLSSNPFDPRGLSSDYILDIFEDATNNLWIGTVGFGINKLNLNPQKFYQLKKELNNPNSLNNNFIFTVCEDKEGIKWIGTFEGGINKYNSAKNKFTFYKNNPSDKRSLSSNHVRKIFEDSEGNIWVATYFGGLNKYDKKTDSFIQYKAGYAKGLLNDNIREIFEDSEKKLWLGSHSGGLIKFNRNTGEFLHFMNDPGNENSLSDNVVNSICEDKDKNLWIGTFENGLNKFDKSTNSFKRFIYNPDDSTSLSANYITTVYCDKAGNIWVGTWNGGLNLYNRKQNNFSRFREKDGLLSDIICGIGEDTRGNLWISTVKGLSKFSKDKNEFTNYDISDGIQQGELNPGAFFINKEGWIYFGGTEGVNVFHPDSLVINSKIAPVVITSIKKFNEEIVSQTQPPFLKELEFNSNEDVISFEFSSLDFSRPSKNQYAYKLEGFDEHWIASGTRNFITYTNLDPGKYIFKVRGTNSDGVWNEEGSSLNIIINPPWWKTGWAYSLYILFIAAGLLTIRKFEKNRLKLRNELKFHEYEAKKHREIENMKSRFFANLSHEFRTPLMLIKGPVEKLLKENENENISEQLKMIYRSSKNLQTLIDQLLELAQLEASSIPLKAKEENLVSLLRGLISSFDSLAKERNIQLQFDSLKEDIRAWIDRDKLEKIIYNLLSNAFKFTNDGGNISVRIESHKENFVNVTVEDSGSGISEDKLDKIFDRFFQADDSMTGGSGIGLALVKELVELHKWEISVSSKVNVGTKFNLKIPLDDYLNENEKIKELAVDDTNKTPEENFEFNRTQRIEIKENEIKNDKPAILIVEDSKDVRIYLSDLLKTDYNIFEAANGKEGIRIASDKSPDLIISDIMMPEMDGIEFCRQIKTEFQTSHIPVILLTAKVSDQSKYEGLETGADDYLTKPFDSKELFIRIKNLLLQRKKLREKFAKEIRITAETVTTNSIDNEFLNKAFSVAEKNLSNPDFDSANFAKEMFVSRSQLHRKLIAITGQAPGEFLRTFRLKKAAQLILEKKLSITQIAYEVGFNSPSHFTKAFQQYFNCLPSGFSEKVIS